WVVVQPLLSAGIFAFVFGQIARLPSDGIPYFIFAYSGLLAWTAFNTTLTRVSGCVVQNSHLVLKVSFPRLVLPFSTVFSVIIDFSVALLTLFVLMVLAGVRPWVGILLLPVWLFLVLLL